MCHYQVSVVSAAVIFSDGFESGNTSGWTSTTDTMTVDTSTVHSGTYSAKVTSTGSGGKFILKSGLNTADPVYLRGYFQFSGLDNLADTAYCTFMYLSNSAWGENCMVRIYKTEGIVYFQFWFNNGLQYQSDFPVCESQWYSIELARDMGADSTGMIGFWINGCTLYYDSAITVSTNTDRFPVGMPNDIQGVPSAGVVVVADDIQASTTYNNIMVGAISLPARIEQSGSYYLEGAFTGTFNDVALLTIATSDVTFDGKNYLVTQTEKDEYDEVVSAYHDPALSGITIQNFYASGGLWTILMVGTSNSNLINCTIENGAVFGLYISSSTGNQVVNSTIANIDGTGSIAVMATQTEDFILNNTEVSDSLNGVYIKQSIDMTIIDCSFGNDTNGLISDTAASGLTVTGTNFLNCGNSTNIGGLTNFTFTDCLFKNFEHSAFYGWDNINGTFDGITITNDHPKSWVTPIFPAGIAADYNCDNITVTNSILNNTFMPLVSASSRGITGTNNMFGNCSGDVCFFSVDRILMQNNTFKHCGWYNETGDFWEGFAGGVELSNSNATIRNNTFIDCFDAIMWEIWDVPDTGAYGTVTINENIFLDNAYTIRLDYATPTGPPEKQRLIMYNNIIADKANIDPSSFLLENRGWEAYLHNINVNFLMASTINGVPINEIASVKGVPLIYLQSLDSLP